MIQELTHIATLWLVSRLLSGIQQCIYLINWLTGSVKWHLVHQ